MRWRRAARSITKWVATAAAILIAGAWVESGWWYGYLRIFGVEKPPVFSGTPKEAMLIAVGHGLVFVQGDFTLRSSARTPPPQAFLSHRQPLVWRWNSAWNCDAKGIFAIIPLWAPFLLVAAPAGLLWRMDILARRRRHGGACGGCGYDRRGLAADAKCPECGAVAAPASK